MFVPVVNLNQEPLMPTTPSRAYRWIRSGKATPFWKKGIFCVRLNTKTSETKQEIALGIDPGSKREAFTIKSALHTYSNVLTNAVDWVKKAIEDRRNMRRARRFRNMRRRACRFSNRKKSKLAPSTKARWQWKLRVCKWLLQMFPISGFVIEDIKAKTKGQKRWDKSFSPLEVGKHWFYEEVKKLGKLYTKRGYETKELRDELGLKKSSSKLADKFECHNVDSWVLANWLVGGHLTPDNKEITKIVPLQFHRRQLHSFQCAKGGKRREYGGTRSMGFKRGSLVKHKKYGFCYVGGTSNGRISLHSCKTGERLCRKAKTEDCIFKTYLSFRKENVVASRSKKCDSVSYPC